MKAFRAFCGLMVLTCAARGAWQEELTTAPGTFPPFRPFHTHYKFGWKMFTAAEADIDLRNKDGLTELALAAHSIGVVRGMWRMDAKHVATMDPATLLPGRHDADGNLQGGHGRHQPHLCARLRGAYHGPPPSPETSPPK